MEESRHYLNPKPKTRNSKQIQMIKTQNPKRYDLDERTFKFARRIIAYCNRLLKTPSNLITGKQLIRSASSVGANYIEAEDSLSRKDFAMRIKICRKEAKESQYWLRLSEPDIILTAEKDNLIREAVELTKIFGSIVNKVK